MTGEQPVPETTTTTMATTTASSSSSSSTTTSCKQQCSCAKLPFRLREFSHTMFDYSAHLYLFDGFYFGNDEFEQRQKLNTMRGRHSVATKTARRTAETAQRCVAQLQQELASRGLVATTPTSSTLLSEQSTSSSSRAWDNAGPSSVSCSFSGTASPPHHLPSFTGSSTEARIMAPLAKSELVLGARLGSGGFATVYEIDAFCLSEDVSAVLHPTECAAREFLSHHAHYDPNNCGRNNNKNKRNDFSYWMQYQMPTARYVVKHLKKSLVDNAEEARFEKAAVDLALEAQLLLALSDHAHICSIRGWTQGGTDALKAGTPDDYFLILDCLPQTLDDAFFAWRQSLRKYKSRSSNNLLVLLNWNKRKFQLKIKNLMLERLQVAHDVGSAIEYMHERRIIYRDLKSSNIGLDHHGAVQLFDLGLARLLPNENETTTSQEDGNYCMSRVGTNSTMAPEVRNKQPYGLAADVYSFGIVLWEILSLSTPSEYFRLLKHSKKTTPSSAAAAVPSSASPSPTATSSDKRENKTTTAAAAALTSTSPSPTAAPSSASPSPMASSSDKKNNAGEENVENSNTKNKNDSNNNSRLPLPICPCWPPALQALVRECLSYDPRDRPSMAQARATLQHQMEELFGVHMYDDLSGSGGSRKQQQRRRSTFRLDLTTTNTGADLTVAAAAAKVSANDEEHDDEDENLLPHDDVHLHEHHSKSKRSLASTACVDFTSFSDNCS